MAGRMAGAKGRSQGRPFFFAPHSRRTHRAMRKPLLPLLLLLAACTSTAPATSPMPATATTADNCHESYTTINATLWMQTSAEYAAITREVYETAGRTLDAALADPAWTAAVEQTHVDASMPPAIILDIDETILDTSGHQALQIRNNDVYTEAGWHEWAMHDQSRAIDAARDFLLGAQKRGVNIFYVTNRDIDLEQPLRATLTRLGFPLTAESLLMRGQRPEWKTSDKSPRRAFLATKYRVIMLFGDDLNDFAFATGKPLAERNAIVTAHVGDLGRKWFVLPNPVYGSWEGAASSMRGTPCEQLQKKIDALRP
jgi:5'-nucleotidase (lipoprotein e(P4) family)